MEKIKNKQSVYEEPLLEVVHLAEKDIITSSTWEGKPQEGELIPLNAYDDLRE